MKFVQFHIYKHQLETILKFYQNEDVTIKKMTDLGSRNVEFESSTNEFGLPTIRINREVGVEPPERLKEFVSRWNKSSQIDVWSSEFPGQYTCHMTFYSSAPVRVTASMEFRTTAKGCTNKTTTEIHSTIPVLGSVIEKYVQERIMEEVGKEYFYIAEQAKSLERV